MSFLIIYHVADYLLKRIIRESREENETSDKEGQENPKERVRRT
ncbi:MAG: hypothetical protein ACTSSP_12950 [Candidatus Asgardarchaeia archaeon]